jgi:three-Cys-motif partner protein
MSSETVWELEPHTKAKHEILVTYLQAWFGIMGSTAFEKRALVFDGFAGPGIYRGGQPGSPLLAVQTLLNHSHFDRWDAKEFVFLFNEQDEARYSSLEDVLDLQRSALPGHKWPDNVKVHSSNDSFTDLAERLVGDLEAKGRQLAPTFAFVDPFGYKDVPLDVIRRLLAFNKCELFIYFDFNSANRFAGKGAGVNHLFEALFGCDEFYDAPATGPERGRFLHDLYERQLKEVCNFAHVRSFRMVHKRGHTNNYLFFATRNTQAFDRMKYAMWKAAPGGDYSFADRLADQDVLFDESADTTPLQRALLEQFAGRTVSIEEVVHFVICSTPYHSSHVKRKTLVPMQKAGQIRGGPNQKKPNQFPDGTLIVFP